MEGRIPFAAIAIPAMRPPPTHRNQKHLQIGESLQHLQGDGSLSSDDLLIIIRMYEFQAPVARKFLGVGTSLI